MREVLEHRLTLHAETARDLMSPSPVSIRYRATVARRRPC